MLFSELSAPQLLESLPDAAVVLDGLGTILSANDAFLSMLGRGREETVHENIVHFLRNGAVFDSCIMQIAQTGRCIDLETLFVHKTGRTLPALKNVRKISHQGKETLLLATVRHLSATDAGNRAFECAEIVAQDHAHSTPEVPDNDLPELPTAVAPLEKIFAAIQEIIWYIDDTTMHLRYVNHAVEAVFGVSRETFLQQPDLWQQRIYAEDREAVARFFRQKRSGGSHSIDFRINRTDGEVRWLNSRITYHPELQLFIGITYDATNSKSNWDMVEFLAYHDTLTRLPNRVYLKEKIEEMIERARTIRQTHALFFLDLDNFKYLNDTLGHETGDVLLIAIASRLQEALPSRTELIRFGGDEFIVLLKDIGDHDDIEACGNILLHCFAAPYKVRGQDFFLTASIGIALYPDHAVSASDLIKHADTAMYAAKRLGRNRFNFYTTQMDNALTSFLDIGQRIGEGIRNHYFRLHYQPIVDANHHHLVGFEALLRFEHPNGEVLSPEAFIPVAEKTGKIIELGELAIREACAFSQRLNALTGNWLPISVNLSARQFQDNQLLQTLRKHLHALKIPPHALRLEVTESIIMQDVEAVHAQLQTLRTVGFTIALDDFGTGNSSLECLAKLPIDTLKIDKSFVISLFESRQNQHLVSAITTMAGAMAMNVTAEGVETARQAAFLRQNGADAFQGHFFSPALPPEIVENNVRNRVRYFAPYQQPAATS